MRNEYISDQNPNKIRDNKVVRIAIGAIAMTGILSFGAQQGIDRVNERQAVNDAFRHTVEVTIPMGGTLSDLADDVAGDTYDQQAVQDRLTQQLDKGQDDDAVRAGQEFQIPVDSEPGQRAIEMQQSQNDTP